MTKPKTSDIKKDTPKKRGNPANLKSFAERTVEEQRKIATAGGIKSGVVRKEKKLVSQIYMEMIAKKYSVPGEDGRKKVLTGAQLLEQTIKTVLIAGGGPAVSLLKEWREATEGSNMNINAVVETVDATEGMSFEDRKKLAIEWAKKQK